MWDPRLRQQNFPAVYLFDGEKCQNCQ